MKDVKLLITKNGGAIEKDIVEFNFSDSNGFIQLGIEFCPKIVCRMLDGIKVAHQTFTLDVDDEISQVEQKDNEIAFNIFNKVFETLLDADLVKDFILDELECYIEASHPKYKFLENINSVVTEQYYGICFNIIDLPFTQVVDSITEVEEWLNKVIEILNNIKCEFEILKSDQIEYKIKSYLYLDLND